MGRETMTHERARLKFTMTDTDIPEGTFRGLASVFGSLVDSWIPTVIEPGAFARTLLERSHKVKILWQHNTDEPIGIPIEIKETPDGLAVHGKVSQTTLGKDALILMRDGVIDELSIGFDPVRWEMVEEGEPKQQVRHIHEVRLWEFSLVTFAADPNAKITAVHSKQTDEERLVAAFASIGEVLSSSDIRQRFEPWLKVNRDLALKAHGLMSEVLSVETRLSSEPTERREPSPEVTPDPGITAARHDELVDALLWNPQSA